MNSNPNIDQLTAHLFREDSGKMVAVLSRLFGLSNIDTVLDIVQDTFETALTRWRFSGVPDNPSGWLMQVAKNKAVNALKRDSKTQAFEPSVYLKNFDKEFEHHFDILLSPGEIRDSQLRLLFTCCHPQFSPKNQVMITLNILCGFGVPEIANALLMNEATVKKALTRSKASLRKLDGLQEARVIMRSDERIETVHTILYLIFNEGYKTTRSKEAIDHDLCYEAIRLTRIIANSNLLLNSTTNALLALMFFNISRFSSRMDTNNEWLTLEEQDRSKWDKVFIGEAYHYLDKATQSNTLTRFHIEAIIASIHCAAPSFEQTDWSKIAFLYRQLESIEPSPLVTLNRIIAESYLPETVNSISALDELQNEELLNDSFLIPAAKADIYKRKGETEKAYTCYSKALNLSISPIDKKFLEKKMMLCKPN